MNRKKICKMTSSESHKHTQAMFDMAHDLYDETLYHIEELTELTNNFKDKIDSFKQNTDQEVLCSESEMLECYDKLLCCIYALAPLIGLPMLTPYNEVMEKFCLALSGPIYNSFSIHGDDGFKDYLEAQGTLIKFPFMSLVDNKDYAQHIKKAYRILEFIMSDKEKE